MKIFILILFLLSYIHTANVVRYGGIAVRDTSGDYADVESNGGLAVNIQDQHTRAIDLKFARATNATTLNGAISAGDYVITLTATTGFIDGTQVGVFSVNSFFFAGQVGAPSDNDITLDSPLDIDYIDGSNVLATSTNMAVNGGTTPVVFQIGPVGGTLEVDVTRIMGYIQDGTAMDDAKFGGISALTNGVVLRLNNGVMQNIWNIKSNGDIGLLCFDLNYSDKAPAGSYGLRFRNTFAGPSKHGVTLRLEADETLEIIIQDDLTDLEAFYIMAQGHLVGD